MRTVTPSKNSICAARDWMVVLLKLNKVKRQITSLWRLRVIVNAMTAWLSHGYLRKPRDGFGYCPNNCVHLRGTKQTRAVKITCFQLPLDFADRDGCTGSSRCVNKSANDTCISHTFLARLGVFWVTRIVLFLDARGVTII